MVLLAGTGIPENLRIRRSRIFRAPQLGVLAFHVQDVGLHLKGKLIRIPIESPAPIRQPLHPAFLVAVDDFVAGLAGDSELPAELR
jgi:hypothetical protein